MREDIPAVIIFIHAAEFRGKIQIMSEKKNKSISGNFVVCDIQEEYADHLFEILTEYFAGQYQFHLFHNTDRMSEFLSASEVEVLLIGEECICKSLLEQVKGNLFILTGRPKRKEKDGIDSESVTGIICYPIFRYQSADQILLDIRKGLGWTDFDPTDLLKTAGRNKKGSEKVSQVRREGEKKPRIRGDPGLRGLIGVYSPVHRIGKTRFAIRLGEKAAQHLPVLYLNLEGYSGRGHYFPDGPSRDLGDLLYCAKQDLKDHGLRISTMAGQFKGLDYIMPMGNEPDLREIKKEEWIRLIDMILEKCIYETVILDLGDCVDGLYEILRKCERVYTPYITDRISVAKLEQYEQNLKDAGYSDVLRRTVRRRMDSADHRRKAELDSEKDRTIV